MWGRVFPLLFSASCKCERGTIVAGVLEFAWGDYVDFADLGTTKLSDLEVQVLDSLYGRCSGCTSPEVRRSLLERRLRAIPPDDKARGVVLTMFKQGSRSSFFERLFANYGYAGHRLLHKLCSDDFIKHLTEEPKAPVALNSLPREFCRAAKLCRDELESVNQCLTKKVREESKRGLPELAENSSGFDLAIYAIRTMDDTSGSKLCSLFAQLVDSWSGDAVKRGKLMPSVIEFLQIALIPKLYRTNHQADLRQSVVEYVLANTESFELFRIFPWQATLSKLIEEYIGPEPKRYVSPAFVTLYLVLLGKNVNKPDKAVYKFFFDLLPAPAAFHAPETVWNSDPERLNTISPRWLREMFDDLRTNPAHGHEQRALMHKYMGLLRYEVFVRILKRYDKKECVEMALFMLAHLSTKAGGEYLRCYYLDIGKDIPHKMVLGVFPGAFKRSLSDQRRPDAIFQGPNSG
ncbi:hypothetical protein PAPHI01_1594 [Pancytospora philotis]|nr:hypothetical protein PAPHI01_1594 [Pancytospora philotis]